ncbi:MAG: heat shock protein HspQ, partial [Candidatus Omnitrophica bacterium]|nr:heat shock protein HspQ [Candidatus Omnitrophota bacterium]
MYDRLESALVLIAQYLSAYDCEIKLKKLLDQLAGKYQAKYHSKDPRILAHYLFEEYGMQGNEDDYYNPQNSNPIYVIKEKKGIPISLASIYMLVGDRLDIPVEGCPFPGHFLARVELSGKIAFVDCYNSGQIIMEEDFVGINEEMTENVSDSLTERIDAEGMIRRYLANLIRAYQINEDQDSLEFIVGLFKDLDLRLATQMLNNITPNDIINGIRPKYRPGNVVKHTRYGYRGIIVDVDMQCKATDEWYYGNQLQPSKNQPWVHLLVDDSEQVTYVAENNLEEDDTSQEIVHPLVSYFFIRSKQGLYIRNDNAWPDTEL